MRRGKMISLEEDNLVICVEAAATRASHKLHTVTSLNLLIRRMQRGSSDRVSIGRTEISQYW